MKSTDTLFSLPGDWIPRNGKPAHKPRINRILVLKPDHIGDLLIAQQAFALLRHLFPSANIELICGKWNVKLAKSTGLFTAVHGVNLFHEVSGSQSVQDVAEAARSAGAAALRELQLGFFDLAIDLRYDTDTRPMLFNIDAAIYAGFGTANEFPFLDIVIPRHESFRRDRPTRVSMPGEKFIPNMRGVPIASNLSTGNGDLSSRRNVMNLHFDISGAATPQSLGTANDERLLGIGIERILISPVDDQHCKLSPPVEIKPNFGNGWAHPEVWGCWSAAQRCQLSIPLPRSHLAEAFSVEIKMRAHVNSANPIVTCVVTDDTAVGSSTVNFDFPVESQCLTLMASANVSSRSLSSPEFELDIGRYTVSLKLFAARPIKSDAYLTLIAKAREGNVELMRRDAHLHKYAKGIISFNFELETEVGRGGLIVDIQTKDVAALEGVRIQQLDLNLVESRGNFLPIAHMEDWASLLVLRCGQLLSNEFPFGRSSPHLTHPTSVSGATDSDEMSRFMEVSSRLAGWKAEKEVIVGIALGCNSEIRKWPIPYFLSLIERILDEEMTRVVFIGSPADAGEALDACIHLGIDANLHSLCGIVGLEMLGPLLSSLDLFIGNNTGTTHFAGSVGVRAIGIYAGTNHPREWGPIGKQATWILRNEPCSPCHLTLLKDCNWGHRCMMELSPDTVFELVAPEIKAAVSRRARSQ